MQPYPYGSGGRSLDVMMMYPLWIEITGGHSHTRVAPTAMIMECATGLAGVVGNPATRTWSVCILLVRIRPMEHVSGSHGSDRAQ